MFEDITRTKKDKDICINATLLADGHTYKVKACNMKMAAGTVVGYIRDDTRRMDGYTNYKISIPIKELNCEWSFNIMLVRVGPDSLKFQTVDE
jgi:hypothetical protein